MRPGGAGRHLPSSRGVDSSHAGPHLPTANIMTLYSTHYVPFPLFLAVIKLLFIDLLAVLLYRYVTACLQYCDA